MMVYVRSTAYKENAWVRKICRIVISIYWFTLVAWFARIEQAATIDWDKCVSCFVFVNNANINILQKTL